MAMNNWGGIREHMSKKPRTVFKSRNKKRSNSSDKDRGEYLNSRRMKMRWWKKEDIFYLIIFIVISFLGIIWMFKAL